MGASSKTAVRTVRDLRFHRPPDFDLAEAWTALRQALLGPIPEYVVTVRVAPAAEPLLAMLEEGRLELPLQDDVERDEHGWARLDLRFERPDRAARHLVRLGADVEVLAPPEMRDRMRNQRLS
ncbi:WYL domain-containing protein [Pseudonocardia sediminis]|uniref:WYL domain-containing protein n=1 Tax=Pseudonocardia sediminis TaxID=1397368 RepID=A0A4Q7USQ9_PSEST|nr:WYL domain-containing protein [Pseudonocardia sediminis]RZT84917.1 WYL domain-containing protein [Pseudonocardia sediminis]